MKPREIRCGKSGRIMEVTHNSLQTIIALNTVLRNILLAKLAYTQGAIGNEAVEKVKEASILAMSLILKSCVDKKARRELEKIVKQIKTEILGER